MADRFKIWTPEEWQSYIVQLLRCHYPTGHFQEIPDAHLGDAGLEGYSMDGCAYQCYAPEEPILMAARITAHRGKINRDINKFAYDKVDTLAAILQAKIRRWVLVVPQLSSKDVLETAKTKADEVRAINLPYVADDFVITVTTDEEWSVAAQKLRGYGLARVAINPLPVDGAAMAEWQANDSQGLETLGAKVHRMRPNASEASRTRARDDLIRKLVAGKNILDELHANYNKMYEDVRAMKQARENYLEVNALTLEGAPSELLKAALTGYQQSIAREVPGIDDATAEALGWEAIADWLCRCPLDFPEP